jgi:hypothetical protein
MYTAFICLGGTGTQLGYTIGNLFPLLRMSGITEAPFSIFILDKDTNSGIYKACTSALQRYEDCRPLLPFDSLPPYELTHAVYQEMQEGTGLLRNANYTVMDLIGKDAAMKELAAMCWAEEKRDESIRDGNNRDPSRGSLDAQVCLEHLVESSLYNGKDGKQGLQNLVEKRGAQDIRVVILGGATGGMGSSLIVPLTKKLRESFPGIRIDLVILGPYFEIPQRKASLPGVADVDNIGTSLDSFYRAADQLQELAGITQNDWRVFYAAIPGFDDTAGKFEKNGAVRRRSHLLELVAALAGFHLGRESSGAGFYQTSLSFAKDKSLIGWTEIPWGAEIKKPVEDFMKLLSVLACKVFSELSLDAKDVRRSGYLKQYFKKNPADEMDTVKNMQELLKVFLQNAAPYFEFWQEVQLNTHLGYKDGSLIVDFFPSEEMNTLAEIMSLKRTARENEKLPLWGDKTWQQFLDDLSPNKKRLADAKDANDKLKWMIEDIWNIYHKGA